MSLKHSGKCEKEREREWKKDWENVNIIDIFVGDKGLQDNLWHFHQGKREKEGENEKEEDILTCRVTPRIYTVLLSVS